MSNRAQVNTNPSPASRPRFYPNILAPLPKKRHRTVFSGHQRPPDDSQKNKKTAFPENHSCSYALERYNTWFFTGRAGNAKKPVFAVFPEAASKLMLSGDTSVKTELLNAV
ncbi:MAG: hypothetical protein JSU94_10700, partial [Phycisphaerales bacterium]